MSKRVTRRTFLQSSLVTLTSASQFSSISVAAVWNEVLSQSAKAASPFSTAQLETLRAAADEIIPAGDGQPAASDVQAASYIEVLCGKTPELTRQVVTALDRIEALAKKKTRRSFTRSSPLQRVTVLRAFERESARASAGEGLYGTSSNLFATLRDLVYEAYYTNPRVWSALHYQFHPTSTHGPRMEAFDESILATMKKRAKSYREVK